MPARKGSAISLPDCSPAIWAGLSLGRPRVMAILNITPDSFSDGGVYGGQATAVAAGMAMAEAGADIIDVGGESTRPGARLVAPEEEQARVLPVIGALAKQGARISIDTRNAATMAAALDAGAAIVNDVSALTHDPAAMSLVARRGCPVVLMHMRGTPESMNQHADYPSGVVNEVVAELRQRVLDAEAAGIAPAAIAVDPGIGFAKKPEQSVALLRNLASVAELGKAIVAGVSRKGFIGQISRQPDPASRFPGSIAAGLFALSRGAHILRVHDVAQTIEAIRVWEALKGTREG